MRKHLLVLALLCCLPLCFAQQLSPNARISVLTIGPGTALNDAFGHNVFRIKDQATGLDSTYDYGRFPFNEPGFYLNFVQGKLNYSIGKSKYQDIKDFYIWQNRTIEEQVLNLNPQEKQALYNFLRTNYLPENRNYLYDFFFDNCATKIRDVLQTTTQAAIHFNQPENFQQKTFRSLIREKVPTNSWGGVGIDIALGSVIDQQATPEQHMFLPAYIHSFFQVATLNNHQLVAQSKTIYKQKPVPQTSSILWSPLVIFSLLAILIIGITYFDFKKVKRTAALDTVITITTTAIGLLILGLWFGTNHQTTAQNYNLLWAFPLNAILLWQIAKKQPKPWVIKFLKFLVIMLLLMAFHWTVGIQVFAPAAIPLFVALFVRYLYLVWYFNQKLNA
ncbi:lipoprotein N-acyltransferase Lnb domain-containing protein [Bizionia sp. KMM 8389]